MILKEEETWFKWDKLLWMLMYEDCTPVCDSQIQKSIQRDQFSTMETLYISYINTDTIHREFKGYWSRSNDQIARN